VPWSICQSKKLKVLIFQEFQLSRYLIQDLGKNLLSGLCWAGGRPSSKLTAMTHADQLICDLILPQQGTINFV